MLVQGQAQALAGRLLGPAQLLIKGGPLLAQLAVGRGIVVLAEQAAVETLVQQGLRLGRVAGLTLDVDGVSRRQDLALRIPGGEPA